MNTPIRILHVVSKMSFGGVQSVIMNYYRNIDRTKIQFDFVVQSDEEFEFNNEIRALGGKIYKVTPLHINRKKFSNELYNILISNPQYKTIQVHQNYLNIIPLIVSKKAGVKNRISHSHSNYKATSIYKCFQRFIFRNIISLYATKYFACSSSAGIWLHGNKFLNNNKSFIMNNAINMEKFRFDNVSRKRIRKELDIDNKYVFIHVGMFGEAKNHNYLIEIFYEISQYNSEVTLLLLGEGENKEKIHELVKEKGIEDKVIFLGKKNNVNEYFSAADSLIFPSKNEGLPVVVVEAQVNGIKCYVSKEAVPNEIDITNNIKFISIHKNPKYWADNIINEIDFDNERKNNVIIKNNGYDISIQAKRLQNYYEELNK